jgi:hypothetical protein
MRLAKADRPWRGRGVAVGVALALVAVGAAQIGASDAAFTAQKSNPSNQLTAASSFTRDFATGTYGGNGTDNRNVTGLGFQPDLVMVKATTAQGTVIRTRTMTGDASKPLFGTTSLAANRIQALNAGGFEVGTDATVNALGTTYQWVAATTSPGTVSVGSYTGDGLSSRTISGLGYSPEAVLLMPADAGAPVLRFAPMTTGFQFTSGTGVASSITGLGADGFTVGNSASANANNTAYHWVTLNEVAGAVDVGSYTGNNINGRTISGLGLTPALVLLRSSSTSTAREGLWRPVAAAANNSSYFGATANTTSGIRAFSSGSFTVNNNANSNANGNPYAYLAVADANP